MPAGTVLFSSRAPIGYVAIAKNPVCTNQGFKSVIPNDNVNSEFLYYQLLYLRKQIQDMGSGTTFKEISAKKFGQVEVVLPEIKVQERIVSRIEELFSQLDSGMETLKKVKQQLTVYRQAVLKEAFDKVLPFSKTATIAGVCKDITVQLFMKEYGRTAREVCPDIPEQVHPHQLRHTRAIHLYRGGMPLSILREFLGHASEETTRIYAYADTEMKRKAIEKATPKAIPGNETPIWDASDDETLRRLAGLR